MRDGRCRHLIASEPPYLAPADHARQGVEQFLGRYILEGSKPGAAAAAVWLSHKAIPLDDRGYGYLIERTMAGARRLRAELATADFAPFRLVLLPAPDIPRSKP
jgi:glutamate/tyrosine decarboxylase-like PLP-dependent enzyme